MQSNPVWTKDENIFELLYNSWKQWKYMIRPTADRQVSQSRSFSISTASQCIISKTLRTIFISNGTHEHYISTWTVSDPQKKQ